MTEGKYLMPRPHRTERIEESDILKQVRIQPEARRGNDHCDDEQDESEHAHGEEQSDEAEHSYAKVPHTKPEHRRPQRKQHHSEESQHEAHGDERHSPRPRLVKERVVEVIADLLLRLDLDVPLALYALGVFGAFFFELGNPQGEKGAREEAERLCSALG